MLKSEIYILPDLKCPTAAPGDYQVNKHLRKHNCHRCRKLFSSHKYMVNHFRKIHKNGINVCFMCKKYFYRINWLYNHEKKCKTLFTQDKQFLCDICDKEYSSSEFPNHILTHLGVTSYHCELCFEHCISKTQFEEHYLNHEQRDNSMHLSSAIHACDLCPSMFNHITDLSFHYLTHIKKMPYSCSICSIAFLDEKDCIIHSHLHKDGKIKCELCNVKFESKLECLLHVVTHNSSKFFRNFFYINRDDIFLNQNFEKIIDFYHSAKILKTKDDLKDFCNSFENDALPFEQDAVVDTVLEYSRSEAVKSEISSDYAMSNDNTSNSKQSLVDDEGLLNGLQWFQNSNEGYEKTSVLGIKTEEATCAEDLTEMKVAELKIKTEPICCLEILNSEQFVSENNLIEMAKSSVDTNLFFPREGEFSDCSIIPNKSDLNSKPVKEEIFCETLQSDSSLEEPGKITNSFDEKDSYLRQNKIVYSETLRNSISENLLKKAIVKLHRLPQEIYENILQKMPAAVEDNLNYKRKRMHFDKCTTCNSGDCQSKLDKKKKHNDAISRSLLNRTGTKPTNAVFWKNNSVFPTSFNAINLKKNGTAANCSPSLLNIEHTRKAKYNNKCKQNIGKPMCNHICFSAANVTLPHKNNDSTSNYSSLIHSPKLSTLEQALRAKCNGTCERNIYGKPMCNHVPDKVLITNLIGLGTNAVNISPLSSNRVLVKSSNIVNKCATESKTLTVTSKNEAFKMKNHLDESNKHFVSKNGNSSCDKNAFLLSLSEKKANVQPSNANSTVKYVVLSGKNSLGLMEKKSMVGNSSHINLSKSSPAESRLMCVKNASINVHNQTRAPVDRLILEKNNSMPPTNRSVKTSHFLRPSPLATKKISLEKERLATALAKKRINRISAKRISMEKERLAIVLAKKRIDQLAAKRISLEKECLETLLAKKHSDQMKLINNTRESGLPVIETVGSVISLDGDKANEGKRSYQIYTPYTKKIKNSSISSQKSSCSVKNVNFPVKSKLKIETPTLDQFKIKSSIPAMLPGTNTNHRLLFAMIKRPYESSLKLENVEKMRDIKGLLK